MITHLLLSLLLAQAAPAPVQTARIEGQILSATTGEPLKKAAVRLSGNFQPGPNSTGPTSYTMSTGADGKFVIESIVPGTYTLSASRTGFVSQNYGVRSPGMNPTPLKLDAGQQMKELAIKLAPQAMIFGRVVDEDGEPVPNAQIQAMRWGFSNGKKRLQQNGFGNSQADGTFVMGSLNGGRYVISADHRDDFVMRGEEQSGTTGVGREAAVKTYFPNALDPESAAPIDLTPGAEMRGIVIHLRKARVYEIRGNIVSADVSQQPRSLMLMTKGATDGMMFDGRSMAQVPPKTSRFQFRNVSPGTYIIRTQPGMVQTRDASGDIKVTQPLVGRAEVTVGDRDVDNVVFALGPGADITGKFTTEGDPQPATTSTASTAPAPQRPSVMLMVSQGIAFNVNQVQSNDDGTFRIKGIEPDTFTVNIQGVPEGSYVKSVRFGGQDITGKELDLTAGGGGELAIVLSPNAADVSGVVRNSDGQPVPSARIQICDKDKKVAKGATSDQNGSFKVTGLAPGDYQVFAWESTGEGVITDPDFRKAFSSSASTIKLSEKSHESVEAKLIGLAAMEVELAKIR